MKDITEREMKRKSATCIRVHLPYLITLPPLHLIGFSRTFSYHHVWQQGNSSSPCVFTLLSRTLISADSQSAPTRQAWVNKKKGPGFLIYKSCECSAVQALVPHWKERYKKHEILCNSSAVQNVDPCAVSVKIQELKKRSDKDGGRPLSTSPQIWRDRWWRNKTRTNVCRSLVWAQLTFSMAFRKHPTKSKEKGG